MFILFRSETSEKYDHDFAQLSVRARNNGQDVPGPIIEEPGWWTFGMSFTPDGQVHQYASPGIDDLTEEDRLYSSMPYGNRTHVRRRVLRQRGQPRQRPNLVDAVGDRRPGRVRHPAAGADGAEPHGRRLANGQPQRRRFALGGQSHVQFAAAALAVGKSRRDLQFSASASPCVPAPWGCRPVANGDKKPRDRGL